MKKILFLLFLTLLFISCTSNTPEVQVIKSEYTPHPDSILVAVPEAYNDKTNYPLVLLLHGWSGNYAQWNSIMPIQDLANAYNFIVVCPDGYYDSWYLNNHFQKYIQYEEFFWKDLIPFLRSNYSIDSRNIFITGLSMGGHGAITLYLKNPSFFNSAGSTSGILDICEFPENWGIKNVLGDFENNKELWFKNSAYYLLDSTKVSNLKIFVDCGLSDFAYDVNLNFVVKCREFGNDVKFHSIPGDHSKQHWGMMIDKHFQFFFDHLVSNE